MAQHIMGRDTAGRMVVAGGTALAEQFGPTRRRIDRGLAAGAGRPGQKPECSQRQSHDALHTFLP